jgi:hypothetical protein
MDTAGTARDRDTTTDRLRTTHPLRPTTTLRRTNWLSRVPETALRRSTCPASQPFSLDIQGFLPAPRPREHVENLVENPV